MAGRYVILSKRAIVRIAGNDARPFLQGLISQDIERVSAEQAAYGAFLTPQGKYLHDFCIAAHGDDILLDCEAARADDLVTRLSRYRLRADVAVTIDPGLAVAAIYGDAPDGEPGTAWPLADGLIFIDPRCAQLGRRAILPRTEAAATLESQGFEPGDEDSYDALRVALTVPEGMRDLDIDRTVLLEANFDVLNGIDWQKGCYLGQELTARTKYRGLVKRRLVTVGFDGPAPTPGTPILSGDREVGVIRTVAGQYALASLRLDAIDADTPLRAGDATVQPA